MWMVFEEAHLSIYEERERGDTLTPVEGYDRVSRKAWAPGRVVMVKSVGMQEAKFGQPESSLFQGERRQGLRMGVEQPEPQEGTQEVICKIQKPNYYSNRENPDHRRVLFRQPEVINY